MIADEIVTGFARTGRMFACEHEGVTPDLMCLGKSLTAGYLPMAATLATTQVFDAFLGDYTSGRHFQHGHTFGGNPLAAAAALASLDLLAEERMVDERVPRLASRLAAALKPLADHPHIAEIRQLGTIVGIELAAERAPHRAFPPSERRGYRVCKHATANGVWLRPLGDVIVVMPPLAIADADVELLGRVLTASIDPVCSNEKAQNALTGAF
jgi:adenosylmethionine-8-amino-7-oxononanoate aminotransferase